MLRACWTLVARRAHSRSEMRLKLRRRGFAADDVELALARMTEEGLLDDADFAIERVRGSRPTRSRQQIAADLDRRGVGGLEVRQALAELSSEHDLHAARALARRWPGLRPDLIGQRLARRGFAASVVCRILTEGQEAGAGGRIRA